MESRRGWKQENEMDGDVKMSGWMGGLFNG